MPVPVPVPVPDSVYALRFALALVRCAEPWQRIEEIKAGTGTGTGTGTGHGHGHGHGKPEGELFGFAC